MTQLLTPSTNVGWGEEARRYLEKHGFVPQKPYIHSGDLDMAIERPFIYYLSRILGIVPLLSISQALTRGSYAHVEHEYWGRPDRDETIEAIYNERCNELREYAKYFSIDPNTLEEILFQEEKDFKTAIAWWRAASHLRINDDLGSFDQFLRKPQWEHLGTEVQIMWEVGDNQKAVALLDRLMYHKAQNQLHILDVKSTADNPIDRVQTCMIEGQTQHYLSGVKTLLDQGVLQKKFNLPADCTLGGMYHWVFRKPTIVFGTKDCPRVWRCQSKRTGLQGFANPLSSGKWSVSVGPLTGGAGDPVSYPNKAEALKALEDQVSTKPKECSFGEPCLDRFTERCRAWYREEHGFHPVNMSHCSAALLQDKDMMRDYNYKLGMVKEANRLAPEPNNFVRTAKQMKGFGKGLNRYAPLFLNDPSKWPEILQQSRMGIKYRDEIPTEGPDLNFLSKDTA